MPVAVAAQFLVIAGACGAAGMGILGPVAAIGSHASPRLQPERLRATRLIP